MDTERLERFASMVKDHSARLNLVSAGDLDRIYERHVVDSLRAVDHVVAADHGPCADVGSGAGFPGIPLAVATPDRQWTLIEPRRGRAGFLEEAIRALPIPNADVVCATAEQAARRGSAGRFAVVTARALAPPDEAVRLCRPLLRPAGRIIVFLGEGAEPPEGAAAVQDGLAIVG